MRRAMVRLLLLVALLSAALVPGVLMAQGSGCDKDCRLIGKGWYCCGACDCPCSPKPCVCSCDSCCGP
jgi:hypothetical protein